jgi:hypothetical protein
MIWLLKALGWAKTALTVLADLARRYPCQVALVVALAACAWLWRGWDKAEARIDAMEVAAKQSEALHRAAIKAQQDKFDRLKKETDDAYKASLADAGDRTDRFIAANRLRGKSCAAQAAAPSQGQGPGSPEKPAAEAFVAVTEADVKACAGAWVYAQSSYEWAQKLIAEGLGE